MLQIKATNEQVEERIQKFIERKREEINKCNIRDFCVKRKEDSEDSCARIDAVLVKRKDSKGHLQGIVTIKSLFIFLSIDLSSLRYCMFICGLLYTECLQHYSNSTNRSPQKKCYTPDVLSNSICNIKILTSGSTLPWHFWVFTFSVIGTNIKINLNTQLLNGISLSMCIIYLFLLHIHLVMH